MALSTFPTLNGITFPQKRMPHWEVVKQDALSGKRTRYPLYSYPIWKYELPISFLRSDTKFPSQEWQTLIGFINSQLGATNVWQYSDPIDNTATAQLFGSGTGSQTQYQLVRSLGGFTEPVFLPNTITSITVGGTPTAAYTQPSTSNPGLIQFNTAPANLALLAWTGTFYWPCRFDDEDFDFSRFMTNLWEYKALKFSTEKLA